MAEDDAFGEMLPALPHIDPFTSVVAATSADAFIENDDILGDELDALPNAVTIYQQANGLATISSTAGGSGRVELVYDGLDGSADKAFGLDDVDLTNGGLFDAFLLQVTDLSGTVGLEVRVYSGSDPNAYQRRILIPGISETGLLEIPFSRFDAVGAGASFDSVTQIEFIVSPSAGESIELEALTLVPEPGIVLLHTTALLARVGAGALRRRVR